jgi:hypothetical protein
MLRPDKRAFAKRVTDFAKRVSPRRPVAGFPLLWIGCAGAMGLMVVTGGFGTGEMPLAQRSLFWLLLMGVNAFKWQIWFGLLVHKPADWVRASLIGTALLNLSLPLEIALCGRAVGVAVRPGPVETWSRALAISFGIIAISSLVTWAAMRRSKARRGPALQEGLLERARIVPGTLAAIQAEDHYCRVLTRDGQSALIHYRFGDALGEVAELDGAQVHRGAWVAANAVAGARRDGRRWRIVLADGTEMPVSSTYAPEARRRHWLRQPPRGAGV